MEYLQDDDWMDEEELEERCESDPEYLFEPEDAEASDQEIWDADTLARTEREWDPSEEDDAQAIDEAVDPVLKFAGDVREDPHDPEAPISTATLLEQLDEVSVERRTQVARTAAEFDELIREMDRLDRNRERRERYHEILKAEIFPEGNEFYSGRIVPASLDSLESKLILRGMFLDILFNCPYEMHELTGDPFISHIVRDLSDLHKETLYFLSLQYYSTSRLACMRDQSDRNIRKLRDNYTKKLQKQLYAHLCKKKQEGYGLSFREKEFICLYEAAMNAGSPSKAKVKKENKYPKRIKKAGTANSAGTEIGVAV